MTSPYEFDPFFASGRAETVSPFLTPRSRRWSHNLPLKNALLSALFLLLSFVLAWHEGPASHLCLIAAFFVS